MPTKNSSDVLHIFGTSLAHPQVPHQVLQGHGRIENQATVESSLNPSFQTSEGENLYQVENHPFVDVNKPISALPLDMVLEMKKIKYSDLHKEDSLLAFSRYRIYDETVIL
jgi:hypothetical protein